MKNGAPDVPFISTTGGLRSNDFGFDRRSTGHGRDRAARRQHGFDRRAPLEIGGGRTQKSLMSLGSVTGQTVGRTFESGIFSQRSEDEQVVAGADAVFLQSCRRSAGKPAAYEKVSRKRVACRRRIFLIHGRPKFHLGAARIDHQASRAVIEKEGSIQDFLGHFFLFFSCAFRHGVVVEAVRFRKRRDQGVRSYDCAAYFYRTQRRAADGGRGRVLDQAFAFEEREAAEEEEDTNDHTSDTPQYW